MVITSNNRNENKTINYKQDFGLNPTSIYLIFLFLLIILLYLLINILIISN